VATRSPFVRRRRLGQLLKGLRAGQNLTVEHVGKELDWSPSKVSRIETAAVKVSTTDLRALLDLYGVTAPEEKAGFIELGKESRESGYWMGYKDNTPVQAFDDYVGFEAEASVIRVFDPTLIPGLLQTPEYARAVITAMLPDGTDAEMGERVALRMARQQILSRQTDTVSYWTVIDEAALRRPMGGEARKKVMREQIAKVIEAAALPRVTVQVLPFEAGAHAGLSGSFTILELPHPADPNVVYTESMSTGVLIEDPEEVRFYRRSFERIQSEALGRDSSAAFLRDVERSYT
jgi:transcriptional regulator with XRE-family HTH domain